MLSQCLGPEQPGRVRGVSSYKGWKHGFTEHSNMYRKRKRVASVDLEAIKDQVKAEVTSEIMSMLAAQGLQLQLHPFSRTPTPG